MSRFNAIGKVIINLNPEDSKDADIIQFYVRLAELLGLDPAPLFYDCTKINVSKNIQRNIFEVLDARSSDPFYSSVTWVARGPITDPHLPDDTVELSSGFFCCGQEEKPLSFNVTLN